MSQKRPKTTAQGPVRGVKDKDENKRVQSARGATKQDKPSIPKGQLGAPKSGTSIANKLKMFEQGSANAQRPTEPPPVQSQQPVKAKFPGQANPSQGHSNAGRGKPTQDDKAGKPKSTNGRGRNGTPPGRGGLTPLPSKPGTSPDPNKHGQYAASNFSVFGTKAPAPASFQKEASDKTYSIAQDVATSIPYSDEYNGNTDSAAGITQPDNVKVDDRPASSTKESYNQGEDSQSVVRFDGDERHSYNHEESKVGENTPLMNKSEDTERLFDNTGQDIDSEYAHSHDEAQRSGAIPKNKHLDIPQSHHDPNTCDGRPRAHSAPDTVRQLPVENTAQMPPNQGIHDKRAKSAKPVMTSQREVQVAKMAKAIDVKDKRITDLQEEVGELKKQISDLTESLATEMNSKISANESDLENISVGIRPMTVADDYTNFCSDSWLEACTALEEEGEEEDVDERYQLLCHVLIVCEKKTNEMYQNAWKNFLANPFYVVPGGESAQKQPVRVKDEPENLIGMLKDSHRKYASKCDLKPLVKAIKDEIKRQFPDFKLDLVETYISDAAFLTYKMALQKPPMLFDISQSGKPWDGELKSKLEPYFGSEIQGKGRNIQYYVFPILLHGDKVMVPGKVMVK